MTLTEHRRTRSTTTDIPTDFSSDTMEIGTIDRSTADRPATLPPTDPAASPPRRSVLASMSWVLITLALAGVAVLVVRLAADDAPAEPAPMSITDPKDMPGYRSPTLDRELTTGDPKDHPTYRLATTSWQFTTGDPKDHPGYRSPTGAGHTGTTGDPKDHPGYRSPTGDGDIRPTTGDPKDHPGYRSPFATD